MASVICFRCRRELADGGDHAPTCIELASAEVGMRSLIRVLKGADDGR